MSVLLIKLKSWIIRIKKMVTSYWWKIEEYSLEQNKVNKNSKPIWTAIILFTKPIDNNNLKSLKIPKEKIIHNIKSSKMIV